MFYPDDVIKVHLTTLGSKDIISQFIDVTIGH